MSAGPTSPPPPRSPARCSKGLGYEPRDAGARRAGHLCLAEEQGHRRLPRQLDADHDRRRQALHRRRVGRDRSRRISRAPATASSFRPMSPTAGLKSLTDIGKFKDKLDGKIYGIEPGNDGNRIVLGMIEDKPNGLDGFELVESSRGRHAVAGREGDERRRMDRLPRLDAASGDGRDGRSPISTAWATSGFGAATVSHQRPRRLRQGVPECRQAPRRT